MSLPGQKVQPDRYTIIPRTLIFPIQGSRLLLLKLSPEKGAWSGNFNGLGGHIEQGEIPRDAALREIDEEAGLAVHEMAYVGFVMVDTGSTPGIGLFVFVATVSDGELIESEEGTPVWIEIDELSTIPLVEDLSILIPQAMECYRSDNFFYCKTTFDEDGKPHLELFIEQD